MEENHATLNATKFEEYIQGSSGEAKDGEIKDAMAKDDAAENYAADGGIFMQIEVEGEEKSQEVLLELINTAGERISAQELSSIEALKHLILPDTLSVKIENSNSSSTEYCNQNEIVNSNSPSTEYCNQNEKSLELSPTKDPSKELEKNKSTRWFK